MKGLILVYNLVDSLTDGEHGYQHPVGRLSAARGGADDRRDGGDGGAGEEKGDDQLSVSRWIN